jgi:hypothetical protein
MRKPKHYETGDPEPHGVTSSEEPLHGDPPHHDYWSSDGSEYEKGHEEDADQWDAWEPDDD